MRFQQSVKFERQNRSTEGSLKLKRSVDMTSSGKNGLNVRTDAIQMGQDQVSGRVSFLCWLAAPIGMFHGKGSLEMLENQVPGTCDWKKSNCFLL